MSIPESRTICEKGELEEKIKEREKQAPEKGCCTERKQPMMSLRYGSFQNGCVTWGVIKYCENMECINFPAIKYVFGVFM